MSSKRASFPNRFSFCDQDGTALFVIGLLIFLFFSPYIFSSPPPFLLPNAANGLETVGSDLDNELWGVIRFTVSAVKQEGYLPLWRPYLLGGAPLVGHPSAPVFYPPFLLFLLLPMPLAMNWLIVIHLIGFASGTYLLLRRFNQNSVIASGIATVLLTFAPKWIGHIGAGHLYLICALAYCPWLIFFGLRFIRTRRFAYLPGITVSLAALVLLHPSTFAIAALFLGSVTVFPAVYLLLGKLWRARHNFPNNKFFINQKDWKTNSIPVLAGWIGAGGLAFGLIAVQILPMLGLYPLSFHSSEGATFTSLPPIVLLAGIFRPEMLYHEWFIYVGIGLLLFTLYGIVYCPGKKNRMLIWIGLVGVLLSLGDYTPLYALLFKWNPSLAMLRVPPRWWLLTLYSLTFLTANGIDQFIQNKGGIERKGLFLFFIALFLYGAASGLRALMGEKFPFLPFFAGATLLVALVVMRLPFNATLKLSIISILCLAELWQMNYALIRPVPENQIVQSNALSDYLQTHAGQDERILSPTSRLNSVQVVANHLLAADGYDPMVLESYAGLLTQATQCQLVNETLKEGETWDEVNQNCMGPQTNVDWLKLLNVRYVAISNSMNVTPAAALVLSDAKSGLYRMAPGPGPVFGLKSAQPTTSAVCQDRLKTIDLFQTALIEGIDQEHALKNPVKILGYDTVRGQFMVNAVADEGGFILRSESWAPGWKASIDGQPAGVLRVDCTLQGIWVPPGRHKVVFRYDPIEYQIGKWISLASLLILITISSPMRRFVFFPKRREEREREIFPTDQRPFGRS